MTLMLWEVTKMPIIKGIQLRKGEINQSTNNILTDK
jgi:hypothetical protein